MKMDQTEKLILEAIDQHRDEIIEFAKDIYDHGELGYKEFNTAEKFIKKMKELGLRTETGLAITGTKAYLNEEKKDTASLALLGELDALRDSGACSCESRDRCGTLLRTSCTDGWNLWCGTGSYSSGDRGKTGWTGGVFCNTVGRVW